MTKNLYLIYALLATFATVSAHVNVIDTATALQNKLSFIAQQKEVINQEEPKLIATHEQAKQAMHLSMSGLGKDNVNGVINKIDMIVGLILETKEFTNYSEYMTDFQSSLIATGGLKAEELPTLNPDKALFLKINEIIKANLSAELQKSSEIMTFLGSLLTLKANAAGTSALLEKLTLKQEQLTAEIESLSIQ